MTGKEKCKLLRQIRKEIAEINGIAYITTDCRYEGDDCQGTCPKCDEEVAYLDSELNRKLANGDLITLSGLSLDTFQAGLDRTSADTISFDAPIPTKGQLQAKEDPCQLSIEILDLSVRSFNVLKRAGIYTVGNLIEMSKEELLGIRYFGRTQLDEVQQKLSVLGLSLRETSYNKSEQFMVDVVEGGLSAIGPYRADLEIEDLNLSVRTFNLLVRSKIRSVGSLIQLTKEELERLPSMNPKSIDEIISKLSNMGLSLFGEELLDNNDLDTW